MHFKTLNILELVHTGSLFVGKQLQGIILSGWLKKFDVNP